MIIFVYVNCFVLLRVWESCQESFLLLCDVALCFTIGRKMKINVHKFLFSSAFALVETFFLFFFVRNILIYLSLDVLSFLRWYLLMLLLSNIRDHHNVDYLIIWVFLSLLEFLIRFLLLYICLTQIPRVYWQWNLIKMKFLFLRMKLLKFTYRVCKECLIKI